MAKESIGKRKDSSTPGIEAETRKIAEESGAGTPWLREDGAICFGDECVVIKPTEQGKLGLTIKPTKCGEETGRMLLDHLVKTAGKGVLIEIPSEIEETKK